MVKKIRFVDLAFVNRITVAERVINIFIQNGTYNYKKWITLSQTYGIGKTVFCEKFVQAASEEFWNSKTDTEKKRAELIRNAHHVYIDLQSIPPFRFNSYATLNEAVTSFLLARFRLFATKANVTQDIRDKLLHIARTAKTIDNLGQLLEEELPDEGFIFVFDEIDIFNSFSLYQTFTDHNKDGTDENLKRLHAVWCILAPLVRMKNCFAMSCSKSPNMAYVGYAPVSEPPCTMVHIILDPLSERDQLECYMKTNVEVIDHNYSRSEVSLVTLLTALGVTDMNHYIKRVAFYSAGVPRILRLIATALCERIPDLSSPSLIETFLNNDAFRAQKQSDLCSIGSLQLFTRLTVLAVHNVPVPFHAQVQYGEHSIPVLYAISLCNFHYAYMVDSVTEIQLYVPYYILKLMKREMELCKYYMNSRSAMQTTTGPNLQGLAQVLIIEKLFSTFLEAQATSVTPTWGKAFQGIFSKCRFAGKSLLASAKMMWNYSVLKDIQPCQFFQNPIMRDNSIVLPYDTYDSFGLVIAFNRSEKEIDPVAAVEIVDNFNSLSQLRGKITNARKQFEKSTFMTLVLVFVGSSSKSTIGGDGLLLTSGDWDWKEENYKKLNRSTLSLGDDLTQAGNSIGGLARSSCSDTFLQIPLNMEVLFLSPSGLRKLLGDKIVRTLLEAKHDEVYHVLASHEGFNMLMDAISICEKSDCDELQSKEQDHSKSEQPRYFTIKKYGGTKGTTYQIPNTMKELKQLLQDTYKLTDAVIVDGNTAEKTDIRTFLENNTYYYIERKSFDALD